MNDIDFALSISTKIGSLYKSAKDRSSELPDYSLGCLRGLCHLICDLIADGKLSPNAYARDLDSKIYVLFKERLIDSQTKAMLHQLRVNGNVGAHPEKYFLSRQEFRRLCNESLVTARKLLEITYRHLKPGSPVPQYEVLRNDDQDLKELCYQAMIGGDPESRHVVGKLLLDKAADINKNALAEADTGGYVLLGKDYQSFLDQGYFWHKLASESQFSPSMYEYGVALANGLEGDEKRVFGESLVYQASRLGDANACAFIGHCYLHGSQAFDIDLVEARNYLELAAAEDHPAALADLGAMYEKGMGGPANLTAAVEYTLRAAEAGYPQGQYNLSVFYFNGRGVPNDEMHAVTWLIKSANQGYPPAMLSLARLILEGRVEGRGKNDAEVLYSRCLPHEDIGNDARYELASLYMSSEEDYESQIKAAHLLQECYEREGGDSALAKKCSNASPALVRRLKRGFSLADDKLLQGAMLVLNYFDSAGRPVKNRKEQVKSFIGKLDQMVAARHLSEAERIELAGQLFVPDGVPRKAKAQVIPWSREGAKIGRNDPCPCGSGKKFKACCGP